MLVFSNGNIEHQKNNSQPFQGVIKYCTNIQNKKSKYKNLTLYNLTNQNFSSQSKSLRRGMSCELYPNNLNNNLINNTTKSDKEYYNQRSMDNIFFKFRENKNNILTENLFNFSSDNNNNKKSISLQKKKILEKSNKLENKNNQNLKKGKSTLTEEKINNNNKIKRTNSHNITYNNNNKVIKTENIQNSKSGKNFYKPKLNINQFKNKNLKKPENIILKENKAIVSFYPKKNSERAKNLKQIKFEIPQYFRNSVKTKEIILKTRNQNCIKTEENKKVEKILKINETKKIENDSDSEIIDNTNNSEDCLTKDLDEEISFISNNKGTVNERFLFKKNPLINKVINNNDNLNKKDNNHIKNNSLNFPIKISPKINNEKNNLKRISDIIRNNLNANKINRNINNKEFHTVENTINKRQNYFNIESKYTKETKDEESTSYINNIDISSSKDDTVNERKESIDEFDLNENEGFHFQNPIHQFIPFNNNKLHFEEKKNDKNYILKNSKKFFTYIPLFSKLIFNYCDLEMINTLTLINKKFHNSFIPIIYEKIKKLVLNINKNPNKEIRTKIKKYVFKYSPSYNNINLIQKIYYDNLYKCESIYDLQIKKDLPRTFPENILFKEGSNYYNKLYRLLTAYSNYNNKIGYAQGLNLLTAHILFIFEKEEEIFIFLDGMINRFNLEDLIGINNKLTSKFKKIGNLIKNYNKKVYYYLDKNSLSHEFFTANWILTLFSNSILKTQYLSIIWDYMIIFGWNFCYFFIIVIIKFYENDIISFNPDQVSEFMKNLLFSEKFNLNFELILDETFILMEKNNNDV